jgi:uncharacterized protein YbjT (DUF2867 family)
MVAMTTTDNALTLVLGGTGKTGRRIVDRLTARGVPVRVGSRSGEPPFDWEDRSTWAPVMRGVAAAYISFYPDIAIPGAPDKVREVARLAVEHGVGRLVLLSGRGEEEAQRAERLVREVDPSSTIVRCSWFAQNFSEGAFVESILSGVVALPAGDVGEPFVDAEDIADVAVAALTEPGHEGRLYELTGARMLTFAEAVREIADATGRDVRFERISIDELEAALAGQGVPDDVTWLLRYLFTEVLDGRNAHLADGVQRALGRQPRDFGEYVQDTAATGVWSRP